MRIPRDHSSDELALMLLVAGMVLLVLVRAIIALIQ